MFPVLQRRKAFSTMRHETPYRFFYCRACPGLWSCCSGDGLFRRERHLWTGDSETERYWYLYDASGLLRSLDGVNIIHSDPADRERVAEWYWYKSSSFEELFGPVVPDSE